MNQKTLLLLLKQKWSDVNTSEELSSLLSLFLFLLILQMGIYLYKWFFSYEKKFNLNDDDELTKN